MQTYRIEKNAELVYRLKGLGMGGAVLHVGAHPDDEDIGLLAYLTCKFGVRAVYWSATRGEGGQNRIGPYKDEALGVYRTWESQDARDGDGGECLFGPFFDFGYSKNGKEALVKWGKEALVREIVRAIRTVQPHVVISRWSGAPTDLHGHHQAVGLAAMEAFEAAGDADRFPELQDQGLAPWQPLKYYVSADNSGDDLTCGGAGNLSGCLNQELEKQGLLRINTGEFDPVSGRTYQERAWMAYNRHRTQAMGLAPAPGDFYYYFRLVKSLLSAPSSESSFFDGMDPSLPGIAEYPGQGSPMLRRRLSAVKAAVDEALSQFRMDRPSGAADALMGAISLLRETHGNLPDCGLSEYSQMAAASYLGRKIDAFEEVAARCLGFKIEGLCDQGRIIPGQAFQVSTHLWNHMDIPLEEARFSLEAPDGWRVQVMEKTSPGDGTGQGAVFQNGPLSETFDVIVSGSADLSCPYWLREARRAYAYVWGDDEMKGRPFGTPPISAVCRVALGGHEIRLRSPVVCREAFPGGFRELPPAVIPPIALQPKTDRIFLQAGGERQLLELQVIIRNNSSQALEGRVELIAPSGWVVSPNATTVTLDAPGETKTVRHEARIPADQPAGHYTLAYHICCGDRDYGVAVTPIRQGAPGLGGLTDSANCIREEFILTPAQVDVHIIDAIFVQGLKYAYIQGADEEVRDVLSSFDIEFHLVTDEEMGSLDLASFDGIITGPNAYLVRGELRKYAGRFLEYVHGGGTLIVQYQGYGYEGRDFTPYPFRYSQPHDRVTHEDAPVTMLEPDHFLFRLPNAIQPEDFDGWVRDRGLYFFGEWDKRYRTLLSCADPGETPHEGGMVECYYGQGTFLYTGYSFFRQLAAGVSGALRLCANILALPEARILERIDFLKKISLFSRLTDDQLDAVARIMTEQWIEDGGFICREGDLGDELYVVYRGEVKVLKGSGGREKCLAVTRRGDCLGEIAVLGDVPRTAS
ncbi:MAG: cyclic nucleotide-binding domain-containing protein, partial [Deltaproteobacteria bacterium]|nr:cyclic nucleotide-binding domain-containing protein [Deltaproteobacteria bacterium]